MNVSGSLDESILVYVDGQLGMILQVLVEVPERTLYVEYNQ